jgi:hypothetical protein
MTRRPTYSMEECEAAARKLSDNLAKLWDMPLLRLDAECDRLLTRMPDCADIDELSADLDLLNLRIRTMLVRHAEATAGSSPPSIAPASIIGASPPRGRRTFLKL